MKPQVSHPLFARAHHRLRLAVDRYGAAEHRGRPLAGAAGSVVEVGAADGANFALYPDQVTSVIAVEPEPFLRTQAERSATEAAVTVKVVNGTADRLPVSDGSVHVVVAPLVLCSVPDQRPIEDLDHFRFPPDQPSPASPHVLGRAVRPVAP